MKITTSDRRAASIGCETPSSHLVDDYALARIDYRVGRLVQAFHLRADEADDLRQDMIVELIKALTRHDPTQSQRKTFITRALDRRYLHVARHLGNRQKHESMHPTPISRLPGFSPTVNDTHKGQRSEAERVDLALDLGDILPTLPPRLQRVCEELRSYKPSEAARRIGMHRSTMYRAIEEIRRHFVAAGLGDGE